MQRRTATPDSIEVVRQTVLVGEFADEAQLGAVLDRLQDFAIEVVSVNTDE